MKAMVLKFGDEYVARWVAARIPHMHGGVFTPPYTTIGVVDHTGEPTAGLVYHQYQPAYGTIEISMAASSWRWAQPGVIRACLHYPFVQLGVNKVYTVIPHTNARAIKFNRGIGFTQEAVLSEQFGPKLHAVICRLLRRDFDRLYVKPRVVEQSSGEVSTQTACAA